MSLSQRSISALADRLREDFTIFLATDPVFEHRLSEVLSDAATVFIDSELADADEELKLDLAVALMDGIL